MKKEYFLNERLNKIYYFIYEKILYWFPFIVIMYNVIKRLTLLLSQGPKQTYITGLKVCCLL